jgi:hypothetical protein
MGLVYPHIWKTIMYNLGEMEVLYIEMVFITIISTEFEMNGSVLCSYDLCQDTTTLVNM